MVTVGGNELVFDDFEAILLKGEAIVLDAGAFKNVGTGFQFLENFATDKLIYGLNTGFGPMAQYKVKQENLLQLQYNLIRSHCSGSGNLLPAVLVKALMTCRLASLMKGYSGVHPETVELLKELINKNVNPCIYEHGGVGASGDLVQLAHLGPGAYWGRGSIV